VKRALHHRYGRSSSGLEGAVRAAQLYIGSEGWVTIRQQQKLYARVKRAIETLANKKGMSHSSVWEQVFQEARRRGSIRPIVGRDV
jgi:hypothetical protein